MKLPGPKGVITVAGCYRRSVECATDGSKIAEAMIITKEKRIIMQNVAALQKDMPAGEPKPAGEAQFKPSKGTKKILLDEADPDKFVLVGDGYSVDYTSLNKACPKDPFALPRIDQVIDSTAGCELLSFLDAYSGYHQIRLNPADQIKITFITPYGAYCYTTMLFGLKNAGATYQRCMQKCLQAQIGRNVHAYVDDVVVKTKEHQTLLEDLKETYTNLRRFQMKLNPEKCVFGVLAG